MIKIKLFKAIHRSFSVILISFILLNSWNVFGMPGPGSTKWVGTWGTAPQLVEPSNMPPAPGLTNNSLRQVIRASIGGDTLRLNLSNKFSNSPVEIKLVKIAVSSGGSAIYDTTTRKLTFNGGYEFKMDSAGAITSDPFAFKLEPRMDIAITIYFDSTSATVTGHPGSRTTSYILAGNDTTKNDFTSATKTDHWYVITGIDVKAPSTAASVAILGNSITDGRGSTTNLQNRWTDMLSESLLKNTGTELVGVLNMGLGGNCVLSGGLGPTGLSRFDRDILNQQGVRCAIIFEGVNDIGGVDNAANANSIANNLIAAYKQMISDAHAKNILVYGATIPPFRGHTYYNTYSDICRTKVNEWIRNSGYYDAVLDFDKVLRNPQDTTRLVSSYQNDGLHPDTAGYRKMIEYIDLKLFEGLDTLSPSIDTSEIESFWFEPECATVGDNWKIINDALASNGSYVTADSSLNSTAVAPADSASSIYIPFTVTKDTTYYVFARINCVTADDNSYWVKLDTGAYTMVDELTTSGWQWKIIDSFALKAGNHTFTIAYREDGANLDKLCITNYKDVPTGIGKASDIVCMYEPPRPSAINELKTLDGYTLGQNYPNPFSGKTSISFEIPNNTYISLKVYNMLGMEITELAGKEYSPGKHTIEFDAQNLPKGIYFYTIKADKFSANQKMIYE